ncbi:restriction endonuclease subunit S [Sporolactobacillus sp. THM7-4]|nr:restriction endonuclease subunit S [Sporolactobacillus sp. THM7-4]
MKFSDKLHPENWIATKLKDVSEIYDSLHKSPKYLHNGVPMIRVKDLKEGFLKIENPAYVSEKVFEEFTNKHIPQKGELIFSRVGSYGITSYIYKDEKFCLGQNTVCISSKPKISSKFLYYSLISPMVKEQIEQFVTGSTQKTISLKNIKDLVIMVPSFKEQKKISHTLFKIDEKIQNNNIINETLEDLAQSIFKHWFVDFEFPNENGEPYKSSGGKFVESELGMIPEGWNVGYLREICFLDNKKINLDRTTKNFNYIGLEHMPQRNIALGRWESSEKVSGNKNWFNKGDILFGKLRPYFKKVGITAIEGVCSTDILVFKPNNEFEKEYLLLHLIQDKFIEYTTSTSTGTRMPRTGWDQISRYRIVIPNRSKLQAFHKVISPMLGEIQKKILENLYLTNLRDTLLPKLMSGEIRVGEAEEEVGPCLEKVN